MPIHTAASERLGASTPVGRTARFRLTLLPRPELTGADDGSGVERHRRTVLVGDATVALATGLGLAAVTTALMALSAHPGASSTIEALAAMALPAVWLGLLAARGCYRREVLSGPDAATGVAVAGGLLVAGLAVLAYLLDAPLPRLLLPAMALPLVAGSILVRRATRCRLHRERRRGHGLRRVLVVGHPEPAAELIEALDAVPECGLVAVGACLPFDGTPGTPGYGLPMTADVTEVLAMADELEVAAVALGSDLDLSGLAGRRLLDALADRGTDLLAVPGIDTARWAPQVAPVPGAPVLALSRRLLP